MAYALEGGGLMGRSTWALREDLPSNPSKLRELCGICVGFLAVGI